MDKQGGESVTIFTGNIAHCKSNQELEVFSGYIAVANGKIISMGKPKVVDEITQSLGLTKYNVTELTENQLIIPGLIDCHLHAPQFPNLGLGLDKPLLEWLAMYTFPLEKKYEDLNFAKNVYENVVKRTLRHGTTTACYFGSLHLESSLHLAEVICNIGQRAFIGKVSMNVPNDAQYYNETTKEILETEIFLKKVYEMKNNLVKPIITPRFAISCDETLMKKLGELAKKYQCRIQTHVSENLGEVELVKQLNPKHSSYCDTYYQFGLLSDKCILAHAIYLDDAEMALLASRGVSVAHCPASNTRLQSGLCPVRKIMEKGIKVGLGTDVSGGDSASILNAIRRCMDVSSHIAMTKGVSKDTEPITWKQAFYLATLGGAQALSLDNETGNFEVNKDFDALIIDLYCPTSTIDNYSVIESMNTHQATTDDTIINHLQRFLYLGDDRNIVKIYVKGKEIVF